MKKLLLILLFIPLMSIGQKPEVGSAVSFGQTAEEYFNSGFEKAEAKDFYGAIADYNKTIELDPNDAYAYVNRGFSKNVLKDYFGAISDYTKAIELDPNFAGAYGNRGISKENLGFYLGACADWKKAAKLGYTKATKWVTNQCN